MNISGYNVGALLYCPSGSKKNIVNSLINNCFCSPFSLAFCLEDTVNENFLKDAEQELFNILTSIQKAHSTLNFYLPLIFIRIRNPQHLKKIQKEFDCFKDIITGFILPKFFIDNCDEYIEIIKKSNYYYMPIFESAQMVLPYNRTSNLYNIKQKLECISQKILNIRVGGNDLCNYFGVRRNVDNTIFDIVPVANILNDIISTFSPEYIVSGAVFEYYSNKNWIDGFSKEIQLEMLSGFFGKTVIHPNQINILNDMLKVSKYDYNDACIILNMSKNKYLVCSDKNNSRMNEYKTHSRWAKNIILRANIYGIQ